MADEATTRQANINVPELSAQEPNARVAAVSSVVAISQELCSKGDMRALRDISNACAAKLAEIAADYDEPLQARRKAIEALSYLAPVSVAVYPYLAYDLDEKMLVEKAFGKPSLAIVGLGDKAAILLAKTMEADDPNLRLQAARLLGQIKSTKEEVGIALVAALGDRDATVRREAASALGETAYSRGKLPAESNVVVARLMKMVGEKEFGPSSAAKKALGDIGPDAKKAVPYLRNTIQRQDSVDIEAGYALARILLDSTDGLDFLRELVRSPNPMISFNACIAIGRLGPLGKDAAEDIEQHINANNEYVKRVKASVLKAIKSSPTPCTAPVVPADTEKKGKAGI